MATTPLPFQILPDGGFRYEGEAARKALAVLRGQALLAAAVEATEHVAHLDSARRRVQAEASSSLDEAAAARVAARMAERRARIS